MTPENYVTSNIPRSGRSFITKLRSSTLPIRIETGRFERLKESERICKLCKDNKIENEFHFIFECQLYNNLRGDSLNHVYTFVTDFNNLDLNDKWSTLMTDKRIISKFGFYIKECFQLRNSLLIQKN